MFDIHSKKKSICWEIAMFRHFEIHRNLASPVPSSIGRNSAKIQIVAGVPELSLSRNHGHLGSVLARPGIKTTGMMATETRGRMVTETRGGAAACSSYVRALPEQVWTIQNMYFVRLQDFQIKIFVLQGLLNYPCSMICIVADPNCFPSFAWYVSKFHSHRLALAKIFFQLLCRFILASVLKLSAYQTSTANALKWLMSLILKPFLRYPKLIHFFSLSFLVRFCCWPC